jgi:hypothetical protein
LFVNEMLLPVSPLLRNAPLAFDVGLANPLSPISVQLVGGAETLAGLLLLRAPIQAAMQPLADSGVNDRLPLVAFVDVAELNLTCRNGSPHVIAPVAWKTYATHPVAASDPVKT